MTITGMVRSLGAFFRSAPSEENSLDQVAYEVSDTVATCGEKFLQTLVFLTKVLYAGAEELHRDRLSALDPNDDERGAAASTIQAAFRRYRAQKECKRLKALPKPDIIIKDEPFGDGPKVINVTGKLPIDSLPQPLAISADESIGIVKHKEKLFVLDLLESDDITESRFRWSEMSLNEALVRICRREKGKYSLGGSGIGSVLTDPQFKSQLPSFLEAVLSPKDDPLLFSFHPDAISALVTALESSKPDFDPMNLVDARTGLNLVHYAAHRGYYELLVGLVDSFPEQVQDELEEVLQRYLEVGYHKRQIQGSIKGDYNYEIERLLGYLSNSQMKISPYMQLWLETVLCQSKPDNFDQRISELTEEQQERIYRSAFKFGMRNIHQPAKDPVSPGRYAIQLQWINKSPISDDQEYLFSDAKSFHKEFVTPVAQWALANPGSTVNIWYDSEMAHEVAVKSSRQALMQVLKGLDHAKVCFRDIRSLDYVKDNPDAFSQDRPLYFRVDLGKAIASDFVLSQGEVDYTVLADLDMEAMTGTELFDQQTLEEMKDLGCVVAKGGGTPCGFENGFQIHCGNHSGFMNAHRKTIIEDNIYAVNNWCHALREQQVFTSLEGMFVYLLHEDGRFGPFQGKIHSENGYCGFSEAHAGYGKTGFANKTFRLAKAVPTKAVNLPKSHFC